MTNDLGATGSILSPPTSSPNATQSDTAAAGAYTGREMILIAVVVLVASVITVALAHPLGVPSVPHHTPSLVRDASPVVALVTVVACAAACATAGALIAGRMHFDAGVFGAAIALTALSARAGRVSELLRTTASGSGAYATLLAEVILLFVLLGVVWWASNRMRRSRLMRDDPWLEGDGPPEGRVSNNPDHAPPLLRDKLQATVTQAVVMIAVLLLLARTDAKKQVIPAVGAAAFLASLAAYHFFPIRGSPWYWCGPLVVGVVGYAYAFAYPGPWVLGRPPQALASPIPLDYAGIGVAGALIGYWTSRRWHQQRDANAAAASAAIVAARPSSASA